MNDHISDFNDYTIISDDEIELSLCVDGADYVILNSSEDNVLVAKLVDVDDKTQTIIAPTEEEYEKVLDEYISIMEDMESDE